MVPDQQRNQKGLVFNPYMKRIVSIGMKSLGRGSFLLKVDGELAKVKIYLRSKRFSFWRAQQVVNGWVLTSECFLEPGPGGPSDSGGQPCILELFCCAFWWGKKLHSTLNSVTPRYSG